MCVLLLTGCEGPYSTLDAAGPAARTTALLWWCMAIFATTVLAGVIALWSLALKREAADEHGARRVARRLIIGGGILLPSLSILVLLAFGIPLGHSMLPIFASEREVLHIEVTARQWQWDVYYPAQNLRLSNELHIPSGEPVLIHLRARDVVHAFWVPRLAGKLDAIPGHTTILKLEADEPGLYHGQCAEFCGLQHARMYFTVEAHEVADFAAWLQAQERP